MKKLILYIAASLDNMIADGDGSVDWLEQTPNPDNSDYGYSAFFESIDTVIMGNRTYRQVRSFDMPYPYSDKTNFVLTRNEKLVKDEYATYLHTDIPETVTELKKGAGKDIWLVGGGMVNGSFLRHNLIDEMWLFRIPVFLGKGIPLFGTAHDPVWVDAFDRRDYGNGVIGTKYRFRDG